MDVGRFYQRQGNWLASVVRFRTVTEKYANTNHAPEALMRLTESYLALGIPEEAQKAAGVLGQKYPNSVWARHAAQLIQRHATPRA
jgi:outer membrane protein assembly factor BamD